MNEKMREEFERAFARKFGFGPLLACANADAKQMFDAAAWAWEASRESLVIDLSKLNVQHASYNNVDCYAITDVKNRIEAVGLKVKS